MWKSNLRNQVSETSCCLPGDPSLSPLPYRVRSPSPEPTHHVQPCSSLYTGPSPGCSPCTGPGPDPVTYVQTHWTWTSLYRDPPRHVKTCSKRASLYKVLPLTGHIQTCPLWSLNCQQVDGWHSTGMLLVIIIIFYSRARMRLSWFLHFRFVASGYCWVVGWHCCHRNCCCCTVS